MPDRRRWVDVWHAPDRGAALERVHLQPGEHVAAAFAGDRKWCVLIVQRFEIRLVADTRAFQDAVRHLERRVAGADLAPTS